MACALNFIRDTGQALQLGCEYDVSVLQPLTYLLIWLIFLRSVAGNSIHHNLKPYLFREMGEFSEMGHSLMTSHSRGESFNRSLLVISQIELTIEGLES